MEITKREIISSIVIIAFMLIIGFAISDKIQDAVNDKNAEYQKAIHIDDTELFQYGMDTNIGNAFIYGDLEAVDTVTYSEIGGEYMYVEKVKEKYTRHARTVTKTRTVNGKPQTYTTTETYWSWDRVWSEDIKCKEILFCGTHFPSSKILLPNTNYIDTIKESSHVRYKYYGVSTKHTGTIYTDLRNKTISDNSHFYKDCTIEQALEKCTSNGEILLFWVIWIIITVALVCGFYYLDNKWLEN